MVRVFISYSRANAARVEVLYRDIKSLGHEAWLDQDLSGGQHWWDRILQEIRDCEAFVFALSGQAVDSQACLREFHYASALGKPVLPVMVEHNVSDSLIPREISELQRVDYTNEDKAAFAALNRGLSQLDVAPGLPDILPPPPEVPASYLFNLKTEIEVAGVMAADRQEQLLTELKDRVGQGHDAAVLLALITRFRGRPDLLLRVDRELTEIEARLDRSAAVASPPPAAHAIAVAQAPVVVAPPPAAAEESPLATASPPARGDAPTGHRFEAPGLDIAALAVRLADWLVSEGLEAQTLSHQGSVTVQARSMEKWKRWTGTGVAFGVTMQAEGPGTIFVQMGQTEWKDRKASTAAILLVAWPALLLTSFSMAKQKELPEKALRIIQESIDARNAS